MSAMYTICFVDEDYTPLESVEMKLNAESYENFKGSVGQMFVDRGLDRSLMKMFYKGNVIAMK